MQINVGIVMSTRSDWAVMRYVSETLASLRVTHEVHVLAIHRKPELLQEFSQQAAEKGADLLIVGAKDIDAIRADIADDLSLPIILVSTFSENMIKNASSSLLMVSSNGESETLSLKYSDAIRSALLAADMLGEKYPYINDALVKREKSRAPLQRANKHRSYVGFEVNRPAERLQQHGDRAL